MSADLSMLSRMTSNVGRPFCERPHPVVGLGRAVERDLRVAHAVRREARGDLGSEQVAVGDDARGVLHARPCRPLEERLGEPVQPVARKQWLTAVPRDVEAGQRRQLLVEHLQQQRLGLVVEDRGHLGLEAVGAVEVAAQTRHDGERERRAVRRRGAVAPLEDLELVSLVVDEHPADRQVTERIDVGHATRLPGHEPPHVAPLLGRQRADLAGQAVVDPDPLGPLDRDVVARLPHQRDVVAAADRYPSDIRRRHQRSGPCRGTG